MLHTTLFAALGTLTSLTHAISIPLNKDVSVNKPKTPERTCDVSWNESPNAQTTCFSHTTLTSSGLDFRLPRALWSDCRQLHDEWNARDTRGVFTINQPSGHPEKDFFYPVLYGGSCYLAISPGCDSADVGDVDIGRVLHGALQQTSRGGSMAAEGEMTCRKNEEMGCVHKTKWRLYGDLEYDEDGCKVKNGKEKGNKGKKGKKGKDKKKDKRSQLEDAEGCEV